MPKSKTVFHMCAAASFEPKAGRYTESLDCRLTVPESEQNGREFYERFPQRLPPFDSEKKKKKKKKGLGLTAVCTLFYVSPDSFVLSNVGRFYHRIVWL